MPAMSLLAQLERSGCKVDIDSYDPSIARLLPFKAHDATSNQALIRLQVFDPQNDELVRSVTKSMAGSSPHDILTVLTAKFAPLFINDISGRVLAQTSPSFPNDKNKIIQHAKAYDAAFKAEGITRERYCIKIPTTSAGVQAGKALEEEGIRTLGTVLFSLPQAIAASQAGMYAISPYFNPCIAHDDGLYWTDVKDPVSQHPMAYRMALIRTTYDNLRQSTGKAQPQIKGAGFISAREVMAQAWLGCDHVTVLPASLRDLLAFNEMPEYAKDERTHRLSFKVGNDIGLTAWTSPSKSELAGNLASLLSGVDPLNAKDSSVESVSLEKDYVSGHALDVCNAADEETAFRLKDAIETFQRAESEVFGYIAKIQADVGVKSLSVA